MRVEAYLENTKFKTRNLRVTFISTQFYHWYANAVYLPNIAWFRKLTYLIIKKVYLQISEIHNPHTSVKYIHTSVKYIHTPFLSGLRNSVINVVCWCVVEENYCPWIMSGCECGRCPPGRPEHVIWVWRGHTSSHAFGSSECDLTRGLGESEWNW